MVKALIFDFAGVIATHIYGAWIKDNFPDFKKREDFFNNLANKLDKGKITGAEFSRVLGQKSGEKPEEVWPDMLAKLVLNKQLLELIKRLKKTYKIALLTNYFSPWLRDILEKHRLYGYFDEILISSECKMIKPEPEIFYKMLETLKIKSEEAVFIDDKQVNIKAAQKLGIHGLLYTDLPTLQKDLQNLGIK